MELIIESNGGVRCIYDEAVDLHSLGKPVILSLIHI